MHHLLAPAGRDAEVDVGSAPSPLIHQHAVRSRSKDVALEVLAGSLPWQAEILTEPPRVGTGLTTFEGQEPSNHSTCLSQNGYGRLFCHCAPSTERTLFTNARTGRALTNPAFGKCTPSPTIFDQIWWAYPALPHGGRRAAVQSTSGSTAVRFERKRFRGWRHVTKGTCASVPGGGLPGSAWAPNRPKQAPGARPDDRKHYQAT